MIREFYQYGLLIYEDGSVEVVRQKEGVTQIRWIREVLNGMRYGNFAEVNAPGGVMLFCPGAADERPINQAAGEILRGKETVCGRALYLPGKVQDGYRLYTHDRADREKKILEVLIR